MDKIDIQNLITFEGVFTEDVYFETKITIGREKPSREFLEELYYLILNYNRRLDNIFNSKQVRFFLE